MFAKDYAYGQAQNEADLYWATFDRMADYPEYQEENWENILSTFDDLEETDAQAMAEAFKQQDFAAVGALLYKKVSDRCEQMIHQELRRGKEF